ncbi:MAG: beta-lactamase family protein [Bryobacteraceae bacterium]|nr:beta-lactamase family protein [Bryobacteraceae bacterium]
MRQALALLHLAIVPLLAAASPEPRFAEPQRRAKLEAAFPEIEKTFEKFFHERGVPGLVYGIVIEGDLAAIKTFGVRDRASQDPVTSDTVFRIASMTKSFTALAILKLRDEGKLSLEDPVSRWIPEFQSLDYPTADSAPIRVRQLLTHGAGFPEDNPWGDRQLHIDEETFTRFLRQGIPFSTPPDTEYEYSNYGFALLGRIVTAASGTPYREYLEKHILAPLGMAASTLEPSAVPASVRATGYRKAQSGFEEEPSLPHGAFGAMGGLLVSARDLARYVAYQLSAFPPRDGAEQGPVRRSSLREMQSPWRPSAFFAERPSPEAPLRAVSSAYGYGLGVSRDCRFSQIVGHGGGLPGFGSYMQWLPEYGVGLFAMANLTYSAPSAPIGEALDILRKTGALQPRQLPPSPALLSTRDAIFRLWRDWNARDAEALAADNLFLDRAAGVRRKEVDEIKAAVGRCGEPGDVRPENLLRGSFRMPCDRGVIEVTFTLAPTAPPRAQHLEFRRIAAPSEGVAALAAQVAALIASPSDDRIVALAAPSLDTAALRRDLGLLRNSHGACRAGEPLGGDGKWSARFRFECDRGPVEASLRAAEDGKLAHASFARPRDAACAP